MPPEGWCGGIHVQHHFCNFWQLSILKCCFLKVAADILVHSGLLVGLRELANRIEMPFLTESLLKLAVC